jgi:hypothetical protein
VLDSLRTIVVWTASLAFGWEHFCYLNIIGFVVLLVGTLIYNSIVKLPFLSYEALVAPHEEAKKGLLAEADPENGTASYEVGAVPVEQIYGTPTLSKARTMKGR